MTEEEKAKLIADAERAAARAGRMERFYYAHPPFLIAALSLGIEWFTKISLLYTTIVSAITAAATYGAKRKAAEAQIAGYENP